MPDSARPRPGKRLHPGLLQCKAMHQGWPMDPPREWKCSLGQDRHQNSHLIASLSTIVIMASKTAATMQENPADRASRLHLRRDRIGHSALVLPVRSGLWCLSRSPIWRVTLHCVRLRLRLRLRTSPTTYSTKTTVFILVTLCVQGLGCYNR